MWLAVILFLTLLSGSFEEHTVFGKLKSGFQLAGKLLGIDQANGVAKLVSEAFGKNHKKGDASEEGSNIFSGFFRVLGFDTKKLGAIGVNAIIFVAQLISSSLMRKGIITKDTESRKFREGSPFDWMMDSAKVIKLLPHIKDKELPNNLIMYIKERSLDEETGCVQLLICKTSPFIWGMQKVLGNSTTVAGKKSLFAYLPSIEEVSDHAEICDRNYPYCLFEDV